MRTILIAAVMALGSAGLANAATTLAPKGVVKLLDKGITRTELIEHIYDQDFDRDSNTIEVFVTRIRKKLGADVITTIRGLGYSLEEPAA